MKNLVKLFLPIFIPLSFFASSALAQGQITVEKENGDIDVFSDVEIFDTQDIIYLQAKESDRILMITKNKCNPEGELLVCDQAKVGLQSYGVLEELNVEQIYLFINSSNENQTIKGSTVLMSPNTIFLEFATDQGSFVNGFGSIDSKNRPEEAVR
jgi:hypothetical protein